jgi:hypothetical protein
MITLENLKKCTRITICNYDDYQNNLHYNTLPSKRKANAKQTQADPNNKEEESKKANKVEEAKAKLKDEMKPYIEKYGVEMCQAFFDYWSEANLTKGLCRYQMMQTWETNRRLATWYRRDKKD